MQVYNINKHATFADIYFGELQKHVDVFYCLANIKTVFPRPAKTRI